MNVQCVWMCVYASMEPDAAIVDMCECLGEHAWSLILSLMCVNVWVSMHRVWYCRWCVRWMFGWACIESDTVVDVCECLGEHALSRILSLMCVNVWVSMHWVWYCRWCVWMFGWACIESDTVVDVCECLGRHALSLILSLMCVNVWVSMQSLILSLMCVNVWVSMHWVGYCRWCVWMFRWACIESDTVVDVCVWMFRWACIESDTVVDVCECLGEHA